jgi:Ribbon-helix-helix protein, copG family
VSSMSNPYFGKPFFMAKSIKVNQKRRGRPATGRDPVSAVRLPAELTAAVDRWAEAHEANRSDAIRRLVELGLTIKTTTRPVSTPGRRLRALELATKAIEKMIDPSAPPEERAERRRRLTKGPIEFREYRVDLPKAARPD